MNRDQFKKGIEDIEKIGLTQSEKSLIFSQLNLYINSQIDSNSPKSVPSAWFERFEHLVFSRQAGLAFSAFILFFTGFNTIFYANKSLPGDTLYPLKVNIFEPLKYNLTFDNVSKAEVEISNLNERLKEAEILEYQGKLSAPIQEEIEERLVSHTDSFNSIISTVEISDKSEDVKIDFEAKINAHSRILSSINTTRGQSIEAQKIRDLIQSKIPGKTRERVDEKTNDKRSAGAPVPTMMTFSSEIASDTASGTLITASTSTSSTTKESLRATSSSIQVDSAFNLKKVDTEKIIKSAKDNIERLKIKQQVNRTILEDAENSIREAESFLQSATEFVNSGDTYEALNSLLNSRKSVKEADTSLELSVDLEALN